MDIKEEDLILVCPACEGKGWIGDDVSFTGGGSFGPQRFGRRSSHECGRCQRTGKILTDSGEAIAKLISHLRQQGRV